MLKLRSIIDLSYFNYLSVAQFYLAYLVTFRRFFLHSAVLDMANFITLHCFAAPIVLCNCPYWHCSLQHFLLVPGFSSSLHFFSHSPTLPTTSVLILDSSFPMIRAFNWVNSDLPKGFVSTSVFYLICLCTAWIDIFRCFMCSLRCQFLLLMYFVLGIIWSNVAIARAPELSSKTLQFTPAMLFIIPTPCFYISFSRLIGGFAITQTFAQSYEFGFCCA